MNRRTHITVFAHLTSELATDSLREAPQERATAAEDEDEDQPLRDSPDGFGHSDVLGWVGGPTCLLDGN
jgi:hypothetical protein